MKNTLAHEPASAKLDSKEARDGSFAARLAECPPGPAAFYV